MVEQLRALTVLLKDWVQFQTPTSNSRRSIITFKKNKRKSHEGQPRKHLDEKRKIISTILKNKEIR